MISIHSVTHALETLLTLSLRKEEGSSLSLMCIYRKFGFFGKNGSVSRSQAFLGIMSAAMLQCADINSQLNILDPPTKQELERLRAQDKLRAVQNFAKTFREDLVDIPRQKEQELVGLRVVLQEQQQRVQELEARVQELETRVRELESVQKEKEAHILQLKVCFAGLKSTSADCMAELENEITKLQQQLQMLDKKKSDEIFGLTKKLALTQKQRQKPKARRYNQRWSVW
jgi:chromosome segregation ATPase